MKKLIVLFILFFNGCILLDVAKLPGFSNPSGAVVKAEILELSNQLTSMGYLLYYTNQAFPGKVGASYSQGSMTDVFVLQLLALDTSEYYDRESVDKCKDYMNYSMLSVQTILNTMTLSDVNNTATDNMLVAFSLTYLCKIEKGKMLISAGGTGI